MCIRDRFNGATIVLALAVVLSFAVTQGLDVLLVRLTALHKGWLTAAVGCMLLFWLFESLLLHVISRSVYRDVPFSSSVHTVMIGQLYSALTPFSSGGQPVQLLAMQRDGMDAGGAGSALALKSLTWQIGLTLYAVAGALYGWRFFSQHVTGFQPVFALGVAINLAVIAVIAAVTVSPRITGKITSGVIRLAHAMRLCRRPEVWNERVERQMRIFHQSIDAFANKPRVWLASAVLTALQFLCNYMVVYAIYRSFGGHAYGAPLLVAAVALVSLVASFIPLPGGSGGAEGAFYVYFGLFFPQADLMLALLLWRMVTYYSAIVIGAVMVLGDRSGRPVARRLQRVSRDGIRT